MAKTNKPLVTISDPVLAKELVRYLNGHGWDNRYSQEYRTEFQLQIQVWESYFPWTGITPPPRKTIVAMARSFMVGYSIGHNRPIMTVNPPDRETTPNMVVEHAVLLLRDYGATESTIACMRMRALDLYFFPATLKALAEYVILDGIEWVNG